MTLYVSELTKTMISCVYLLLLLFLDPCVCTASDVETTGEVTNTPGDVVYLSTMVHHLTNMLVEQQKTEVEFYAKVLGKLEEQTEMLAILSKKRKEKGVKSKKVSTKSFVSSLTDSSSVSGFNLSSSSSWSYSESSSGPAKWAARHPGCGEENQSPVDLHTVDVAMREHKKAISFSSYDKVNMDTCKLVNTGNTVSILVTDSPNSYPTLSGGPLNSTEYYLTQAVFHWGSDNSQGSEHSIRGTTYPMEMQLIHQTSSQEGGSLVVTSFLFEVAEEDNPFLVPLATALKNIRTPGSETRLDPDTVFSLDLLIQDSISGPYFTYSGSLTYPPCTEVKQYLVFRVPLDISGTQLEQLRLVLQKDGSRMVNNFRPVQPLGARMLAFTM